MKLDEKAHIIARKSKLHENALHIDCELWGWTDKMNPSTPARLLNFLKRNNDVFVVSPHETEAQAFAEEVPVEEFSAQLWRVPIQEDWDVLDEVTKIRIYAAIIQTGKMFFTLRLDRP